MNLLEYLITLPGLTDCKLVQPAAPDGVTTLTQYTSTPPEHSFDQTDFIYNVQARARDKTAAAAFARAEAVASVLGRFSNSAISSLQSTPIMPMGRDTANPPRYEYAVNFEIRRY